MSSEPADLVVVADPADEVAAEVKIFVEESGRSAAVLDVFDAAQLFTVSVRDGVAKVDPEVPLFLRLPSPPPLRTGFDAEFQFNECLAQLWAAAALTSAPVINRPSPQALGSRVSHSAALTGLRAGLDGGAVEIFSSRPSEPPEPPEPPSLSASGGDQWWVQDASTHLTSPWPLPPGDRTGPFRARWSDADPVFEAVVVLAGQAWRCTTADLDHLRLEERSDAVASSLDVTLAAVIWRLAPDLSSAWLVNVEPYPALEQLRMVWLGLGPQLLKVLFT